MDLQVYYILFELEQKYMFDRNIRFNRINK